jgi:hypothetical protein
VAFGIANPRIGKQKALGFSFKKRTDLSGDVFISPLSRSGAQHCS